MLATMPHLNLRTSLGIVLLDVVLLLTTLMQKIVAVAQSTITQNRKIWTTQHGKTKNRDRLQP